MLAGSRLRKAAFQHLLTYELLLYYMQLIWQVLFCFLPTQEESRSGDSGYDIHSSVPHRHGPQTMERQPSDAKQNSHQARRHNAASTLIGVSEPEKRRRQD